MSKTLTGVADIGGSHITAALVNAETATIENHTWQRNAVDSAGTASAIIDAWSEVIATSFSKEAVPPVGVGIAMPGPFDYEKGISFIQGQNKYDALYGLNIKELLAEKLGLPAAAIHFTNDAACFLQGEVVAGAASGYNHVIGLTLGTGLGSAIYKNGAVTDAKWWNQPFQEGIAEDYLSSRWLVQRYQQLIGTSVSNVQQLLASGHVEAVQTLFEEFGRHLAHFLLQALNGHYVPIVVLGGNIARTFERFEKSLFDCLQKENMDIVVKPALLGEQAALIGAAAPFLKTASTKPV